MEKHLIHDDGTVTEEDDYYTQGIVGRENFNFNEAKILSVEYMKEPYETDREVEYGGVKQRTVAGGSEPVKIEDVREKEAQEIIKNIISEFKGYENKNIKTEEIKEIFSKYGKAGYCDQVNLFVCGLDKRLLAEVEVNVGLKLNMYGRYISLLNANAFNKKEKEPRTMLLSFGEYSEIDGSLCFKNYGSFAKIEYKIVK